MDEATPQSSKPGLDMDDRSSFEYTHEVFDLWLKTYEATTGRLLEIPAVGPARERIEKLAKNASVSVNLYSAWMESVINFQNVFMEAMRRMGEKMLVGAKGEIIPDQYKDFYSIWIETYSETFKEFFKTSHFSSDMGTFISYYMEFMKNNREMLEENYLKPLNFIPTKSEIDDINYEVYSLKKTEKDLASQVKKLSESTRDLPTKADIDSINQELQSLRRAVDDLIRRTGGGGK
ncbi:Poly(R)-hydroxyalkanoic acid synthase subunit [Candidatus Methanoperedens nitroreducens]|uniref:Poly(3-hydroxyalkanoate) polymerase subunit PhaE n=1 Tax=Candidatus Methanoperedens nitratireducens TaxID=1392998 RepID=A0A062VEF3_9EURY|nr:poly(R)-hydroxyalkanoic acid synthase subunit PhaE [Candidatus Methanoperedens nitroreducens]KCZ73575.1 Poly(R)-hydroxyalkanoic acid synthase subunit [Candidatus Methanoperedens nitroreducens]